MTDLPIYHHAPKKGEDGVTILKKLIDQKFKWLVRPNHKEHDFGIDAYIDIINELKQVTGKTIAAQVKTGSSYFAEINDLGWIFRGEMSHLNYYLNNELPVIIILVDDIKEEAFWCYCDATKTERTVDKWKITVPFKQQLKANSKDELLKYVSPVRDYVSQLENFWEMNKRLKEAAMLVFNIEKKQIHKKTYIEIIAGLNRLQVNPELVKELKEKVEIFIDGYNEDSRELFEIPEVNEWAKKIFTNTSGLSYFLTKDSKAQFFNVLKMIYMVDKNVPKKNYFEKGELKFKININLKDLTFLKLLYNDLNEFCEKHNLSEKVNREITRSVLLGIMGEKAIKEMEAKKNSK
jgi:hypothetical protein